MRYEVSMQATTKTYVYTVERIQDTGETDALTYEFLDVVDMWPGKVRNNNDAFDMLRENAPALFAE